jgi:hypothetical protein
MPTTEEELDGALIVARKIQIELNHANTKIRELENHLMNIAIPHTQQARTKAESLAYGNSLQFAIDLRVPQKHTVTGWRNHLSLIDAP